MNGEGKMDDRKGTQRPDLSFQSSQEGEEKGWMISEGQNKCLVRKRLLVTPEMENRKTEVSRDHVADFVYVTYRDPITEVYWSEKLDVK